jgi:hypothetical protein
MRSVLSESLRADGARRPRTGTATTAAGAGPVRPGSEPASYPPPYAERQRRWDAKAGVPPHDRAILEVCAVVMLESPPHPPPDTHLRGRAGWPGRQYWAEVIRAQQLRELDRSGDDGSAPPVLRLDFSRSQLLRNATRTTGR